MNDLENISSDLAFIYSGSYSTIITTIFVCILYGAQNMFINTSCYHKSFVIYNIIAILTLSFILNLFVIETKKIFKTIRPCQLIQDKKHKKINCPKSYDIPSGHAALGLFHGLILFNAEYKLLSLFFFLQPIFRYIGKQHSFAAITIGSLYGIITYRVANRFILQI